MVFSPFEIARVGHGEKRLVQKPMGVPSVEEFRFGIRDGKMKEPGVRIWMMRKGLKN